MRPNLTVVLVDCGKKYSVIKVAGGDFRKEANLAVARQHNPNGWNRKPPYIADHRTEASDVPYSPRFVNVVANASAVPIIDIPLH